MSRDAFVSRWLLAAICLPVVVSLAVWTAGAIGQDAKKPEPKPEKPAAKKEGGDKKAKGRLPNNFSKVGIDETQKEKIYAIQAKYQDQVGKLETELKTLRSQLEAEVSAVLTDDQKAKLKKIVDDAKAEQAAKKKANEDKAKAESKKEGEKKPGEAKAAEKKPDAK